MGKRREAFRAKYNWSNMMMRLPRRFIKAISGIFQFAFIIPVAGHSPTLPACLPPVHLLKWERLAGSGRREERRGTTFKSLSPQIKQRIFGSPDTMPQCSPPLQFSPVKIGVLCRVISWSGENYLFDEDISTFRLICE